MDDFQDREITCLDCGGSFTFTAGEQEYYQKSGFSQPKRCRVCREKRKAQSRSKG